MKPKQLKALRNDLGLTQTQMAEIFLVSWRTYIRWERGELPMSGPAAQLAEVLRNNTAACQQLGIKARKL